MKVAQTIEYLEAVERHWDVAVLGAGPAGAVVARQLANMGVSVLLVDRAEFPRPKVCGSCLNRRVLEILDRIGLHGLIKSLGAVELNELRLAAYGSIASVSLPGGRALSRRTLDAALVRSAVGAGAHFLPATHATLGAIQNDRREVLLKHHGIRRRSAAQIVLVAGGLGASVLTDSNDLQARPMRQSYVGAGVTAECHDSQYQAHAIHMAIGRQGYVGLVRVEDNTLDVAAALDPMFVRTSGGMGAAAEDILQQAGMPAIANLRTLPWHGTPALTRKTTRVAAERVMILGDAAGYVEPFTGEGIAWAISSAVAVAPLAMQAVHRWDGALTGQWERTYRQTVTHTQRACRILSWTLRHPRVAAAMVRILSRAPRVAAPVVRRINSSTWGKR